ncbi:hypothetical protein J2X77_000197 [Sphingobacterium sp. 2149]|nr:hypothetical protein [Sphingobacterium sp. 2149]
MKKLMMSKQGLVTLKFARSARTFAIAVERNSKLQISSYHIAKNMVDVT